MKKIILEISTVAYLIISMLLFMALHSQAKENSHQFRNKMRHFAQMFHHGRKKGNSQIMSRAVHGLAHIGVIYKGMLAEDLGKVLGEPNHVTGIYSPGGISYGYGNLKPSTENYHEYYWFHFKFEDIKNATGKTEQKEKLIRWGD